MSSGKAKTRELKQLGTRSTKDTSPAPLTHANTCGYCFTACLCIGRIHTRERRFMGASYKATQVSAPSLSVCFLKSISCHCFSCLQNVHVSTLGSSLLSLLSLSRAGTTQTILGVAAPLQHEEGAWGCAGPPRGALANPGLTRSSSVTQPQGQTVSLLPAEH